ncbi:hypothetical protein [Streptosporangium sp. NPDC087985]|uniref:hypothetical protein n=1 Tax=Streptosporangium sp. NPDC087985 TaxID=3366196 RepID=UPI003819C042
MCDLRGWGGELVELAWELSDLGFDSVVRLPPDRRPSMEVFLPPGRPRVATAQRGRTAVFTWNRRPKRGVRGGVREVVERVAGVAR